MKSYYELDEKEKKELKKKFKKTPGGRNIYFASMLFFVAFVVLNVFDVFTLELGTFKVSFPDKVYWLFFIPSIILSIYYQYAFRQYIKIKNNIH